MRLRPARAEDAEALGRVHVAAWQETYPGVVPQHVIDRLDPIERATMWREAIDRGSHVTVAEDDAGLVGFVLAGTQREPELLPFAGEIYALYLLDRAKRRGIGRALMADAACALVAAGMTSMSLWVMTGNAVARSFYRALGGREVLHRSVPEDSWMLHEIALGWDRVNALLDAAPLATTAASPRHCRSELVARSSL